MMNPFMAMLANHLQSNMQPNMQQFYQLPQATGVAQTQHLNQISYTNGAAQQTTRPSTQLGNSFDTYPSKFK